MNMISQETKDKLGEYFVKGFFGFVFVTTLLYVLWEPMANIQGKDYRIGWAFGMAFGFTFTPVMSRVLYFVITKLEEIGIIKNDE